MATLRGLIDGKEIDCNAKDDVFKHLEDAHRDKLKSDLTNVKLQTKLAPTRKLLELVDQMHPMPGDNQNQQVDNNGNPVNLQNPKLDQNGRPMPNQAPPARPGIGQTQQQNQSKPNIAPTQKKPGFPNANKTSTKDKLANNQNKKQVGGKKGLEIHVKAKSEKINQLNVKKKKIGSDLEKSDYHSNPGLSQMPSRGIGLSGGGPGSGRKPNKSDYGTKILNYKGYTIHKMNDKNSHGNYGTMENGKPQSWNHPRLSNAKQFVRADRGEEDYAM